MKHLMFGGEEICLGLVQQDDATSVTQYRFSTEAATQDALIWVLGERYSRDTGECDRVFDREYQFKHHWPYGSGERPSDFQELERLHSNLKRLRNQVFSLFSSGFRVVNCMSMTEEENEPVFKWPDDINKRYIEHQSDSRKFKDAQQDSVFKRMFHDFWPEFPLN